jgi:hypothetical protein
VLASLPESGILTVGDADCPASHQVVVKFIIEAEKVHFEVNQEAAGIEKLRLSSRLPGLASNFKK